MTADAVLVLGRGISEKGEIPDSAKAALKKAAEVISNNEAKRLIVSGKYSYAINFVPPMTEALAMKIFAEKLGIPSDKIVIEPESDSTFGNYFFIKTKILEPNKWKNIILINYGLWDLRSPLTMEYMLGPDYNYQIVAADYEFPPEKAKGLREREAKKMAILSRDLKNFRPGDHENIYQYYLDWRRKSNLAGKI